MSMPRFLAVVAWLAPASAVCPWGNDHTQSECEAAGCYCLVAPMAPGCTCADCLKDSHCKDKRTPVCSISKCTECHLFEFGMDDHCQHLYGSEKPFCMDSACVGKCSGNNTLDCYQCVQHGDCTDPTRPVCSEGHCYPTCDTDKYVCKKGIRIHAKDSNMCDANYMEPKADKCMDSYCCGECNGDGDCKAEGLPHCSAGDYKCYECTEASQCKKAPGVVACSGHACVPCEKNFPCSAPCVDGLYDCELPCDKDEDCQKGEVCAVNPGDSLKSADAHRKMCQKPCTSNMQCMAFVHTCLSIGGRQFCGQCLKDEHCPTGSKCHLDKYPVGVWGLCGSSGNETVVV